MFDLNSFDLDIDDDVSPSIFSKVVEPESLSNLQRGEVFGSDTSKSTRNEFLRELPTGSQTPSPNIFPDFSLVEESKVRSLKRPCLENEKPLKKKVSHDGLMQRKFPGPAGLLPDKPFEGICHVSLLMEKPEDATEVRDEEKPMVFSQSSGSIFLESSYQKLLSDFNLNELRNPLTRYTVEWLKKTALSKGLQGRKIPFLGLVIHSVDHTMPDPVVVLRDPTGEVHGSLHREVWADLGEKLKPGIAVALRQVGALITGVIRRQFYLNITMNNILALYSSSENESKVEVTMVNRISTSELMRNFEERLPRPPRNVGRKSASSGCLFSTVNDGDSSSTKTKTEVSEKEKPVKSKEGSREGRPKGGGGFAPEGNLASLGIVLSDGDFDEDMDVAGTESAARMERSEGNGVAAPKSGSGGLSQAESLIFDEVLSGIDLNEFEI